MDTRVIADRLREQLALLKLRQIGEAADLDAAMRGTVVAPSVYVVPIRETPVRPKDEEYCSGAPRFRLYGIVLVVENARDFKGGEQLAPLDVIRNAVAKAFRSWPPVPHEMPMTFMGGQVINFNGDGRLWWSDEYGYEHHPKK